MFYKKFRKAFPWVLLCLAGVACNALCGRLVSLWGLPLYLDCVGTIFVAAVGGYLPGVAVGYLSSLVNSVYDPVSVFYCFVSVLIALSATVLYRKGFFRRLPGALLSILVFALIGGVLGSLMRWTLYGADIAGSVSGPLALRLYEGGALSLFSAKFIADVLIDLLDKALTFSLVALALRFVPYRLENVLGVPVRRGPHPVQDAPAQGGSLRVKITLLIGGVRLLHHVSAVPSGRG